MQYKAYYLEVMMIITLPMYTGTHSSFFCSLPSIPVVEKDVFFQFIAKTTNNYNV